MERREQVFVSSTYLDLRDERQAVIQGLLEADCIPAGMELFPASDAEKWDLIKGVIDDSDYYLLIIGGRYGSVDPDTEISFTEMEYDYAVETGKPVMSFLHGNPGSIPVDKSELEPATREKLNAFRAKAETRMVRYWSNASDLDGAVAKSIIKIRKSNPAEGWIRGRHAMTPEKERDIAELRTQVSELTRQLESSRRAAKTAPSPDLRRGDDKYKLETKLTYLSKSDREVTEYRRKSHAVMLYPETSWNSILFSVGPSLMDECSEKVLRSELTQSAIELVVDQDLVPEDLDKETEVTVSRDALKDVLVQLYALGYIENGTKRRQISDSSKYWRLTESGSNSLMLLRAQRNCEVDESKAAEEGAASTPN